MTHQAQRPSPVTPGACMDSINNTPESYMLQAKKGLPLEEGMPQ